MASITCMQCGAHLPVEAAACGRCGGVVPKKSEVSQETVPCLQCRAPVSRAVIICPNCDQPPVWRVLPGINDSGPVRRRQSVPGHNGPRAGLTTFVFYRNRKPTILGKMVDRSWARVYAWGVLPEFLVTLEVPGRRDPTWRHSTALIVAEYNREQYLVSMLGDSDWVRNVRAAGREAILRHGWQHTVRLVEVLGAERAPILKAYLQRAIGARPHFAVAWNAPLDAFERVASRHPVFRIVWQD